MDMPATPMWQQHIFLGSWQNGKGEQVNVIEPATGETISRLKAATAEDVDRAATIARDAQRQWAETPFDQKAEILRKAAALLKERADEINGWDIRECGCSGPKAGGAVQGT